MNLPGQLIAIAVAAFLGLAGIFYGGSLLFSTSTKAAALSLQSISEEVAKAVEHHRARTGTSATPSISELVNDGWLSGTPQLGEFLKPGTAPQTSAPFSFVAVLTSEELCSEINRRLNITAPISVPQDPTLTSSPERACVRTTVPVGGAVPASDYLFYIRG